MKNNNKNLITLFIVILCCITTLISVGFSALNQNLNISGDVDYEEDDKVLYNVFKLAELFRPEGRYISLLFFLLLIF